MNLSKLRDLHNVDVVLANPNRRELGVLEASDISLTLRLNDISEVSMNIQSHVTNAQGKKIRHPYYSKVQSQRLIHISNIGWFKILQCDTIDSGINEHKEIRCESFQRCLNNYGFFVESKPYIFYDPSDVDGSKYRELEKRAGQNPEDMQRYKKTPPSVVGELFQQLQIQLDPRVKAYEDSDPYYSTDIYKEWTIEYISRALKDNMARSFDDAKTFYGYEWIQNQAAVKFECLFLFDYDRLAIKIMTVDEVTKPTNIYLDYSNVVTELKTTEKADDIITILNVNGGGGLNIQPVSPTGMNYLANFDYYKYNIAKNEGDWMSKELTLKLNIWDNEVKAVMERPDKNTPSEWEQLVLNLRALYQGKTELESDSIYIQKKFEDLKDATTMFEDASERKLAQLNDKQLKGNEIFTAEEVSAINDITINSPDLRIWKKEYSFDNTSEFYLDKTEKKPFSRDLPWKCYKKAPKFIRTKSPKKTDGTNEFEITGLFVFDDDNEFQTKNDGSYYTFDENYLTDFDNVPTLEWSGNYIYFVDTIEQSAEAYTENEKDIGAEVKGFASYCKLEGKVMSLSVDENGNPIDHKYHVSKFARYNLFTTTKYWEEVYKALNDRYNDAIELFNNGENGIESKKAEMEKITSRLNLEKRFNLEDDEEKALYKELRDYWFEGEHTNDGFCLYDDTEPEEMIDLARELYDDGAKVLSRINQPTFSISVDTNDFTKIKEFEMFARELELGKTITICKSEDEGVFYYPALTTINLSLDSPELSLEFSNALRPDSSDFMFMDLVNKGVDASRSVSANSREWSTYTRKESTIDQLLYDPLNRVLRINSGSTLQDVVVDSSGILLRKFADEEKSAFDPRQCRLLGNVMIFTNDSWQTARTALGEILFPDPENPSEDIHAYGILAEALIGSLIVGETLYIKNKENTIIVDEQGIKIKKKAQPLRLFGVRSSTTNISSIGAKVGDLLINIGTSFKSILGCSVIGSGACVLATSETTGVVLPNASPHISTNIIKDIPALNGKKLFIKITTDSWSSLIDVNDGFPGHQVGDYIFNANFSFGGNTFDIISSEFPSGSLIRITQSDESAQTAVRVDGEIIDDNTYETTFFADSNGDVYLKGKINANEGHIGGFVIKEGGLYANNDTFQLKSDGSIHSSNGSFIVDAEGKMSATAGSIGGINIKENAIASANDNFSVDKDGTLKAMKGNIANLKMDDGELSSDNFVIGTYTIDDTPRTRLQFFERDNGTNIVVSEIDDGAIRAQKIVSDTIITGDCTANTLAVSDGLTMSNMLIRGNKTSIKLDAGTAEPTTYSATIAVIGGGLTSTKNTFEITAKVNGVEAALLSPQTFTVEYNVIGDGTKTTKITIPRGESRGSTKVSKPFFGYDFVRIKAGDESFKQGGGESLIEIVGSLIWIDGSGVRRTISVESDGTMKART